MTKVGQFVRLAENSKSIEGLFNLFYSQKDLKEINNCVEKDYCLTPKDIMTEKLTQQQLKILDYAKKLKILSFLQKLVQFVEKYFLLNLQIKSIVVISVCGQWEIEENMQKISWQNNLYYVTIALAPSGVCPALARNSQSFLLFLCYNRFTLTIKRKEQNDR